MQQAEAGKSARVMMVACLPANYDPGMWESDDCVRRCWRHLRCNSDVRPYFLLNYVYYSVASCFCGRQI
jgi:hypothetical protein